MICMKKELYKVIQPNLTSKILITTWGIVIFIQFLKEYPSPNTDQL